MSGAIFSPPDPRDWKCSAAMEVAGVELPAAFSVWQPPVENQLSTGNCVAQALANIMEVHEYNKTGVHKDHSVGWIYGNRAPDQVFKGMVVRDACAALCKDGDIPRSTWECLDEMPDCYTKRELVKNDTAPYAKKMGAYISLNTLDECKMFMFKYKLPIAISAYTKEFTPFGGDGGHCVACYGWDASGYLLYTNSWGTGGWVGTGKGKIKFDVLQEAWGMVPSEINFPDVTEDKWYYTPVLEAARDGIIVGHEDGKFSPNDSLTRAELAVIWSRMKVFIQKMIEAN